MALVKSISSIRNLAQLGQEINHVFAKYGHHRALIMSRPLLQEYYHNMDYDWREWSLPSQTIAPHDPTEYIKTQVPINRIVYAPGTPLGYRFRASGDNKYPFDMFVITWQPGQKSPIHYHPVFGCSYLVLQGQIMENRYILDRENNIMKHINWQVHSEGTAGYIDNNIGAHCIHNQFKTPAVSLHIYSPRGAPVRNIPCDAQINTSIVDTDNSN